MAEASTPGVVLITSPPEEGLKLARALVAERLAACVQVIDRVTSVYEWQGAVEEEAEALLVVKTTEGQVAAISGYLDEHHPYDVPECVFLPITAGNQAYLAWLGEAVGSNS
jgi:periplasmic divalent cation tolerance protein